MTNKLWFLTGVSLKRKIKTKWFLAANILLALAIICCINIDTIITTFGGDFNKKKEIYIVDHTDMSYDLISQSLNENSKNMSSNQESNFKIKKVDKTEKQLFKVADEKEVIGLIVDSDSKNTLKVKIISKDYLDTLDTGVITNSINQAKTTLALANSGLSSEQMNEIYSSPKIDYVYTKEDVKQGEEGAQMIMSTVFPILILPFFMLTIFLVQMIGAEVNDEKTTRGMEIIISNVSPKTHFFSKVLAGNIFVLGQGFLLFIYAGIGLVLRNTMGGASITGGFGTEVSETIHQIMTSSIGDKLVYIIPLTLILMVLTFIAYSLLAGILASMTTNIEDFQQLQTPIMIISLVGYYLSILANIFGGSLFIRICAYIPFISAILSPSLLVLGQFGLIEMLVSILLTIITIILLIHYGLKIYKVGILNYSSKDLWKKMFKALKN